MQNRRQDCAARERLVRESPKESPEVSAVAKGDQQDGVAGANIPASLGGGNPTGCLPHSSRSPAGSSSQLSTLNSTPLQYWECQLGGVLHVDRMYAQPGESTQRPPGLSMLGSFGEIHRLGSGTDSLRQSTNTEYLVEMEGMNSHLPAGSSKEHLDKNVETPDNLVILHHACGSLNSPPQPLWDVWEATAWKLRAGHEHRMILLSCHLRVLLLFQTCSHYVN